MLKIVFSILISLSTIMLITSGVYFSIKLRFPQIKWKKLFLINKKHNNSGISPFNSLMLSLGAKIGVGSLAGISLAIYIGGPGTILWIWIISIIPSINTYSESYLGLKYKGGPSYYIENGLKNKILALIYALLILITYVFGFMSIQANTITISVNNYLKIDKSLITIILIIITFLSIIKGLKSIIKITNKLVPLIGIIYISLSIIIISTNINFIPNILKEIIIDAIKPSKIGIGILTSFLIGMQRSIFITESGLGTSAIACSCTKTRNKVELSLFQILGVYFTVFIVSTATALVILTSNYNEILFININGIEIIQYALNYHLGSIGSIILIISIILFAYSTIIAGYYYGESSLNYIFPSKSKYLNIILKILTLILLFIGSLVKSTVLWKTVDIMICILLIINLYTIIKLRKEIIFDYKNNK